MQFRSEPAAVPSLKGVHEDLRGRAWMGAQVVLADGWAA
jgi:hypothetical protein